MFLFFFFFSVNLAGEESNHIEHLVWVTTNQEIVFEFTPGDTTALETFESDPFLTFSVPATKKKNKALLWDIQTQALYEWTSFETRAVGAWLYFRLISDVIPDDIAVYGWLTIIRLKQKNFAGNYDLRHSYHWRYPKTIMRRGHLDWWKVTYKDTGYNVPDEIAIPIFNNLINKGFDVEVNVDGHIQGAAWIGIIPVIFHITRITH